MEQLGDKGNGHYCYVDTIAEARRLFEENLVGTLQVVARDVKVQVDFNPEVVRSYRLIGYENRDIPDDKFRDDQYDGGEVGAGHSVTALYEVIPVGVDSPFEIRDVDSLRYQTPGTMTPNSDSPELMFVRLRYKEPDGDQSRLIEQPLLAESDEPSTDLRFAAAVAGFGMILRESEYCGDDWTLADVLELARRSTGADPEGYRAEFVRLVEAVNSMELLAQATY